ncbi:MAG: hypothetical protein K6F28_11410 [Lachnospiraceae bacterium]|nr:hypothetical protein [Lachnospiraceae bacterium]
MDTRILNSKRNIIAGVLANCVNPVFALVVKSATVRYFCVEYLGLTGVFTSIFQILNLAELGFATAITVNLYRPLKDNDTVAVQGILAYYRRVYRIVGLVILAGGVAVCPLLKSLVGDTARIGENLYILYFLFLAEKTMGFMAFMYKEALFNAAQRLDITKTVYMIIYAVKSCLQLAALAVFGSFYLYFTVLILGTLAYNIALDILSKKKFPDYFPQGDIDEDTRKNIRKQVAGLSVSNILGVSRDSLNTIMVTSFLGLYVTGQYSNYCAIYDAVIGFFLVITKAIMSSIGNSIVSESVEKNYRNLTKMEFLHNMVTTACTVYMLVLYQPFMRLWMGEDLMLADPVMMLFVLYFHIRAMAEVRNAYFSALGYWWKARWIFIAEAVLVIALMFTLGKFFGIAGIVLAPCISILAVNYIGITNLLFKEYFGRGRREYYMNRVLYTVITLAICVIARYICGRVPGEGIEGMIGRGAVCTCLLAVLVPAAMYAVKRDYMKEALSFVRQIIRS